MSINGHENLTMDVANEILQRRNDSHNPKYLTLNVEFSMPNTIEASSGVFNVKLAKTTAGLGVTITGLFFNVSVIISASHLIHNLKSFLLH